MKKYLLSAFVLFLSFSVSFSLPILSVYKKDRGLFGYKTVYAEMAHLDGVGNGYRLFCQDPGLSACRVSQGLMEPNDENQAEILLKYAEDQIANKSFTGSYETRVKVDGEDFLRVYTVTWSCDAMGDGEIIIDRSDLND